MAMFALPRMNNNKERSKWLCEKQEMAKALDLERRLAKSKKIEFEPRLQFLHSVSAAGQARTTKRSCPASGFGARIAIFMLPQTNSL